MGVERKAKVAIRNRDRRIPRSQKSPPELQQLFERFSRKSRMPIGKERKGLLQIAGAVVEVGVSEQEFCSTSSDLTSPQLSHTMES
jgi:hypothetical protein